MRGGIVLSDGELLLPLCDPPFYKRIFTVRSRDKMADHFYPRD